MQNLSEASTEEAAGDGLFSGVRQGSAEWKLKRLGRVTASRVADVVAKTKTGWGSSRANYLAEIVAERLTGLPADKYVSGPMQWGTENEPLAKEAYEFYTGASVQDVGFINHPRIAMSGASPDGLVGADGLIEAKCPSTRGHIETLLGGAIEARYVCQMQWQLACTGRAWCDFVSFDPRMPEEMRLHVERVERDDKRIAELEAMVREFLAEVDAKVSALTAKFRQEAA